jgi:hypothetical protein
MNCRIYESAFDRTRWDQIIADVNACVEAGADPCPSGDRASVRGDAAVGTREILLDHMERAVRLASRAPVTRREKDAIVILDQLARVQTCSEAALMVLQQGNGLALNDGQILVTDAAVRERLSEALQRLLNPRSVENCTAAMAIPRRD